MFRMTLMKILQSCPVPPGSLTSQSERLTNFRRLVCATLVRLSSHQVGEHRFEDVIFLVETSENSCPQLETLYDVNRMVMMAIVC